MSVPSFDIEIKVSGKRGKGVTTTAAYLGRILHAAGMKVTYTTTRRAIECLNYWATSATPLDITRCNSILIIDDDIEKPAKPDLEMKPKIIQECIDPQETAAERWDAAVRACDAKNRPAPEKPVPPDIHIFCTGCWKDMNRGEKCTCRRDALAFIALFVSALAITSLAYWITQ